MTPSGLTAELQEQANCHHWKKWHCQVTVLFALPRVLCENRQKKGVNPRFSRLTQACPPRPREVVVKRASGYAQENNLEGKRLVFSCNRKSAILLQVLGRVSALSIV